MFLHKIFPHGMMHSMSKTPKTERLNLTVEPEFIRMLDEWRRQQPDIPSRSEALRRTSAKTLKNDLGLE